MYSGEFCASPRGIHQDPNAGRYFRTCVEESLAALPAQLARLQDPKQGSRAVLAAINTCRKSRSTDSQIMEEPARRLKGQAYVEAQERAKLKGGNVSCFFLSAYGTTDAVVAAQHQGGQGCEAKSWSQARGGSLDARRGVCQEGLDADAKPTAVNVLVRTFPSSSSLLV